MVKGTCQAKSLPQEQGHVNERCLQSPKNGPQPSPSTSLANRGLVSVLSLSLSPRLACQAQKLLFLLISRSDLVTTVLSFCPHPNHPKSKGRIRTPGDRTTMYLISHGGLQSQALSVKQAEFCSGRSGVGGEGCP